MGHLERAILDFFEAVARKDASLLASVVAHDQFTVTADAWTFTLPALHQYLGEEVSAFATVGYRPFVKALFNTPVNQQLRAFGACITIAENHGKVHRSVYALEWNGVAHASGRPG